LLAHREMYRHQQQQQRLCSIVDVGVALLELFTVRCSGWINCLGFENDKLTYNHYVAPKDVKASLPLYSGRNTTASLMFPVGDANDDYKNQLTTVVSNMANYTSSLLVIYPVTVSSLTSCRMQ